VSDVGQRERECQNRLVRLFRQQLYYRYLGNWEERTDNSNIEVALLRGCQKRRYIDDKLIDKALIELRNANSLGGSRSLYDANCDVYTLLRFAR
jgi:type I restriction enzyme R subunit